MTIVKPTEVKFFVYFLISYISHAFKFKTKQLKIQTHIYYNFYFNIMVHNMKII